MGQVGVAHTLIRLGMGPAYLPAQRYPIPRAKAIMTPTCTALMKRATAPYFSALLRPYSSAAESHARSKNPMRTMMRYNTAALKAVTFACWWWVSPLPQVNRDPHAPPR